MSGTIYITGMGIVSAIGNNCREVLSSLRSETTGIDPIRYLETIHKELPVGEVKMSDDEMRSLLGIPDGEVSTRCALLGMMALGETLQSGRLMDVDLRKCAFISGTTVGGMDMSEKHYLDFFTPESPSEYIASHDCGSTTEMIANHFGRFGFLTTLSTACSSAANAIILGANMIRAGLVDIVVAGGAESLTKYHLNGFNSLKILDEGLCRPFDDARAGLNLGEGAAYMVLESERSMQARGMKPICTLSGWGNASDAYHQTASSPEGNGAYRAMMKALERAEMKPADIDYVNAHGTGTPNNDTSESRAIMRVFGEDVPPFSSTKAFTGHTTSASGSIEAVICAMALEHDFIPVNLFWKNPMSEVELKPHHDTEAPHRSLRNVICNSFGFGGNDSTLILSKV